MATNDVTVLYGTKLVAELKAGQNAQLHTAGKDIDDDFTISVPVGINTGGGENVPEWDGDYTITGEATGGGSAVEEWIGDGNTHLWISLPEGRTSPMLGVCVSGTVTVDWGDGSTPDVLTGTNVNLQYVQYTSNHEYARAGEYVITLIVDGEMGVAYPGSCSGLLSHSGVHADLAAIDRRNAIYLDALKKVELGRGVIIGQNAFDSCHQLANIRIPDSVTAFGHSAFCDCYALASVNIPDGVTSIGQYAFLSCHQLANIRIPDSVTDIFNGAFCACCSLTSVHVPDNVTFRSGDIFANCHSLTTVSVPDQSHFYDGVFLNCHALKICDLTRFTQVPTLGISVFDGIPDDCEIRVPAALVDEWKAAANWSTYADHIVGV